MESQHTPFTHWFRVSIRFDRIRMLSIVFFQSCKKRRCMICHAVLYRMLALVRASQGPVAGATGYTAFRWVSAYERHTTSCKPSTAKAISCERKVFDLRDTGHAGSNGRNALMKAIVLLRVFTNATKVPRQCMTKGSSTIRRRP